MAALIDNNGTPNSDAQPNKRRRKKSVVWEHFTVENIDADCTRAFCKQCKKSFAYITGSKLAGTSHLKRHIALGICPVSKLNKEKNQSSPYIPNPKTNGSADAVDRKRKRRRATSGLTAISFDQESCSHEIAKMIIKHDYPLHIVENPGFVRFARALHPQYNSVNINMIEAHVVNIYLREKQNLLSLLAGAPGRISLSLDLWTSDKTVGYAILTGQFVDCDWNLHRRILSVITLPFPDSESAFNHAVAACFTDWCFENKLFTLTLNQSFSSETIRANLRGLLSIKNSVIVNGQLIIGSCYAHALGSTAQDALWSMRNTLEKVRRIVKYVITSEVHREKFAEVKQKLQVPSTKSLVLDDQTNWNTTYEMLLAASELKEVFYFLDISDTQNQIIPSMDEWREVETLCTYLKLLHDAASILTAEVNPTSNTFFHEVWKIQLELMHAARSPDLFTRNLTKPLKDRFDRYWKDCNLVLAVAVVMDPRFKMKLVEFSFSRIYENEAETWIKLVDEGLHELYLDYVLESLPPPTFLDEASESIIKAEISQDDCLLSSADGLSDFDIYISEIMSSNQMKSELDQYLEESLLPRVQDFDALGLWKLNRLKYPTLSRMASDVLSIPVSTVAPDSVFDTAERKMDSFRSTLSPTTLEALVCSKDWLKYESPDTSLDMQTAIVSVER
ncbi:zinc finger BED domain-containing protein DAYSLEEPER-like [Coffea arabica]|uniref:Zinc finger BED domain-containing protein DAYSLEEPER-like n=1 Tax=Coffea arabica TaxID=13443 RepID=A0A6P6X6K0_COFAR